ncbi:hypothetical protein [Treponema pedis]|uniref:hypothetical protein n=1 Tax=Treponema pedis TaxID=409322 RepID=UPI00041F0315|nr:hypothetical protein [Treponema pedis]
MKILVDITSEQAFNIFIDLENSKVNILPGTEFFLKKVLKTIEKKCELLEEELSEFREINLSKYKE